MGVRVRKDKIPVLVMTDRFRIEGELHVVVGGRLVDEINREREFLPLTGVTIYDTGRENRLDTVDFLALNKSAIIFLTPLAAPAPPA